MNDFFKQIDQELEAQEIERKRQNAQQAFYTQQANNFAKRLSGIFQGYVEPLKQRGFRISEGCNFPYWSLVITSPQDHEASLSIQASNTLACGYTLNYYKNGESRYHKYEALVQQNASDADIKKMIEDTVQIIFYKNKKNANLQEFRRFFIFVVMAGIGNISKGRNSFLIRNRNHKLVARFYWYSVILRLDFAKCLELLGQDFDLSESRICDIISDNTMGIVNFKYIL